MMTSGPLVWNQGLTLTLVDLDIIKPFSDYILCRLRQSYVYMLDVLREMSAISLLSARMASLPIHLLFSSLYFSIFGFIFMSVRLFFVVVEMCFPRHSLFTHLWRLFSLGYHIWTQMSRNKKNLKSTKGEARHVKNRNKSKRKCDGFYFAAVWFWKNKISTSNDNQPNGHLHIANKPLNSPFTFLKKKKKFFSRKSSG